MNICENQYDYAAIIGKDKGLHALFVNMNK